LSGTASAAGELRIGLGWDNHRIAAGRPMILGGVQVECEFGLDGHSDADILLHAVTDAILGAAGFGDIGMHFPDSDPQWKGASSSRFVEHACALVRAAGFELANLDTTVILERPKLKDYRDAIRTSVAKCAGLDPSYVNVKFKTSEKVGPVGEGRSAEAQAIALLRRR
jgi:2-C-methyl-D-erythritol 2,4-cyclodiphosphate synthase